MMTKPLRLPKSIAHQRRAHEVIPGGCHTYAKGDDQFPQFVPPVIVSGAGCRVTDLDGREYIEFGSGLRSITLGHAHPAICDAAAEAMRAGTNFARPAAIELAAAEAMLRLVPGAEMVKFAKHGSDCTTAAVKLARAHTGRPMVAVCRDHPFYSADDWFINTTAMDAGVSHASRGETITFPFNDLPAARRIFEQHAGLIACVMLEGERGEPPAPGYLHGLRDLCREHGAVFVLDETIAGFRLATGGAQQLHGIMPDLSIFGKAMANGFSVSALCGRREIMELGGIHHTDRDKVFLLSLTHGAETHGLAAFLASAKIYETRDVCGDLAAIGTDLITRFNDASHAAGTGDHVYAAGHPASAVFVTCGPDGEPGNQAFRTLFMQELLRHGVLAPSLVVNLAHNEPGVIDQTIAAVAAACRVVRRALEDGVEHYLDGRPVKPVFRRRN